MIALIPSAIHQIVHHPLASKIDWSSLLQVGSGAAHLPPELSERFLKYAKSAPLMSEGTIYSLLVFLPSHSIILS